MGGPRGYFVIAYGSAESDIICNSSHQSVNVLGWLVPSYLLSFGVAERGTSHF